MNVLIDLTDHAHGKLIVDGVDLAKYATGFTLSMQAGECPHLVVDLDPYSFPQGDIKAIVPDGAVYIKEHPPEQPDDET